MILGILQKAWQLLSKSFPDANGILNEAQEIGESQASTEAIMTMLEGYAKSKGLEGALANNKIWDSLKGKRPDEVVPYFQKTVSELGLMNIISSFFSGEK